MMSAINEVMSTIVSTTTKRSRRRRVSRASVATRAGAERERSKEGTRGV